MALTVHSQWKTMVADRYFTFTTIDFDSSYPTGGESLTDGDLGLNDDNFDCFIHFKAGYNFEYDKANQKVLVYWGDNNNASDGPSVEAPDTTNLSTLTGVKVFAFGKKPA